MTSPTKPAAHTLVDALSYDELIAALRMALDDSEILSPDGQQQPVSAQVLDRIREILRKAGGPVSAPKPAALDLAQFENAERFRYHAQIGVLDKAAFLSMDRDFVLADTYDALLAEVKRLREVNAGLVGALRDAGNAMSSLATSLPPGGEAASFADAEADKISAALAAHGEQS
jgi:hypothetical protein